MSRAGKSSLAKKIALNCGPYKVLILDQDDYILPVEKLPRIKNHIDWEHPDTLDLNLLLAAVERAKKSADIVIVEGIFAFYFEALNQLYTHCIYIDLPQALFYERKKQDLRWGKEPFWYIRHIWQAFLLYGRPPQSKDCLHVSGYYSVDIKMVLNHLDV